ncbi:hypothetical protein, partial [Thomasclavelia ramosa]|uniref:hypothetical protein n=1 Tax=Thomasclavelia ramosa TaxID=1547 RepID=UPI001F167926
SPYFDQRFLLSVSSSHAFRRCFNRYPFSRISLTIAALKRISSSFSGGVSSLDIIDFFRGCSLLCRPFFKSRPLYPYILYRFTQFDN